MMLVWAEILWVIFYHKKPTSHRNLKYAHNGRVAQRKSALKNDPDFVRRGPMVIDYPLIRARRRFESYPGHLM